MPFPATVDVIRTDLFTDEKDLVTKYPAIVVDKILRIREMYNWMIANPSSKDKNFIDWSVEHFKIGKSMAYMELAIIKELLPDITRNSKDFHRWRFNEMILETYKMAKSRKDTRTMEKAASSYAKFNRIDVEDELSMPYNMIVVQPFTATDDPSVLGIKPIPNLKGVIRKLEEKYRKETIDIEDVDYEEADLEENELFNDKGDGQESE